MGTLSHDNSLHDHMHFQSPFGQHYPGLLDCLEYGDPSGVTRAVRPQQNSVNDSLPFKLEVQNSPGLYWSNSFQTQTKLRNSLKTSQHSTDCLFLMGAVRKQTIEMARTNWYTLVNNYFCGIIDVKFTLAPFINLANIRNNDIIYLFEMYVF